MQPDHLSWSQINMLHRCGEQYRRRYIEGDRVPPGIALLRGRAIHTAQETNMLAKMNDGELLEPDAVRQLAADAFDAETQGPFVVDGLYEEMTIEEALGAGKDESVGLAGLHAEKVAPEIEPTAIEVRIELPPSESLPVMFVSILDLIHDSRVILDTKTTAKSPPKDSAHNSDQLTSQGLAFQARYGKAPESLALDYLVRTPKKGDLKHVRLETTRTQADTVAFVHRAQSALRMVVEEIFIPAATDDWCCSPRWCGFTDSCPFFRGRTRPTN